MNYTKSQQLISNKHKWHQTNVSSYIHEYTQAKYIYLKWARAYVRHNHFECLQAWTKTQSSNNIVTCMYSETSWDLLGVPQGSRKWASEQSLVKVVLMCSEITCAFCAYLVLHGVEVLDRVISIEHTCDALQVADWRIIQAKGVSIRRIWWLNELDHNTPQQQYLYIYIHCIH